MAAEDVRYLHWSDMDYGGIRIFKYIKEYIFSDVHPYNMDEKSYREALKNNQGTKLEEDKRKKLETIDAGELEVLKKLILENGYEIEQELVD